MKGDYRQHRGRDFFQLVSRAYHLRMELQYDDTLKVIMKGGRQDQEEFAITIDRCFIEDEITCRNIFQRPVEILDYLQAHPNSAALESGLIRIEYSMTSNHIRQVIIKLKRLERMKDEGRRVQQLLEGKDEQIRMLMETLKDHEARIYRLEEILEPKKDKWPAEQPKQEQKQPPKQEQKQQPKQEQKQAPPQEVRQQQRQQARQQAKQQVKHQARQQTKHQSRQETRQQPMQQTRQYSRQQAKYQQRQARQQPMQQSRQQGKEGRKINERGEKDKRRYVRKENEQVRYRQQKVNQPPPTPPQKQYKQERIVSKLADHPQNPHRSQFDCVSAASSLKITHNIDTWSTFINAQEIQSGHRFSYSIRACKSSSNRFCIGFGSRQAFGNKKGSHSHCLYYLSNGHVFFGNDEKKSVGVKAVEGERMVAECDLKRYEVVWRKEGKEAARIELPHYLKTKTLFLMILVSEKDCQFEVTQLE